MKVDKLIDILCLNRNTNVVVDHNGCKEIDSVAWIEDSDILFFTVLDGEKLDTAKKLLPFITQYDLSNDCKIFIEIDEKLFDFEVVMDYSKNIIHLAIK